MKKKINLNQVKLLLFDNDLKVICNSMKYYFFEVLTNSFVPNKFIDIIETINKKISAFKCYKEKYKFPHSRSMKEYKYRGMMSGLKM